jgi:hypothetical protein
MMKIAFAVAAAAALLTPAPLLVGTVPADAQDLTQDLKMAQVDVQIGRDRADHAVIRMSPSASAPAGSRSVHGQAAAR